MHFCNENKYFKTASDIIIQILSNNDSETQKKQPKNGSKNILKHFKRLKQVAILKILDGASLPFIKKYLAVTI